MGDPEEHPTATTSLSPAERSAAFSKNEPKVPRNLAMVILAVVALLGGGGALFEWVTSSVGLNPDSAASTSPTFPPAGVVGASSSPHTSTPELSSPLAAFMGVTRMPGTPAPAFTLTDQSGNPVSLASMRGIVVVLSFFDAGCQDICPVISAEMFKAQADLGPLSSQIEFLTINTDPNLLSVADTQTAVHGAPVSVANWHFLTSDVSRLNSVWKEYGVAVNVSRTSGLVAHNDVMYFIDATGHMRFRATPFSDESATGVFSLPSADVNRWATGIAAYATQLLRGSP